MCDRLCDLELHTVALDLLTIIILISVYILDSRDLSYHSHLRLTVMMTKDLTHSLYTGYFFSFLSVNLCTKCIHGLNQKWQQFQMLPNNCITQMLNIILEKEWWLIGFHRCIIYIVHKLFCLLMWRFVTPYTFVAEIYCLILSRESLRFFITFSFLYGCDESDYKMVRWYFSVSAGWSATFFCCM